MSKVKKAYIGDGIYAVCIMLTTENGVSATVAEWVALKDFIKRVCEHEHPICSICRDRHPSDDRNPCE